ncbi:MAG: glycoside hydrolase family 3 protein [Clostridia bacterium]|nr:glycoside hydrolase family 3 protein [Clostridia bacterium]
MKSLFYGRAVLYVLISLLTVLCVIIGVLAPTTHSGSDTADTSSNQSVVGASGVSGTGVNSSISNNTSLEGNSDNPNNTSSEDVSLDENGEYDEITAEELARLLAAGMSLENKIYMMMMVTPETLTDQSVVTSAGYDVLKALEKYPVGGVICFEKNLIDPESTKAMITVMQSFADQTQGFPLLVGVDEEGGSVVRIADNPAFGVNKTPSAANIKSGAEAYNAGNTIGKYLSQLGFNVNFGPVADVLTDPLNTAIGKRAFSSDPDIVKLLAEQFAKGLHNNGIMATYKHFPGHGGTLGDSHDGFVSVDVPLEVLKDRELVPFASAKDNGIEFVMVGHISNSTAFQDDLPASLSKVAIDVLKNDLGYKGIVITDALNMGAISKYYEPEEAALMAIKAGNDMLLCPASNTKGMQSIVDTVVKACYDGELDEEQINRSVEKIIVAKLKVQQGRG